MRELFPPGELTELAGFAAAVYCGLAIGIMYDLFALLRRPFKGAVTTGIIDMLFYAAAAAMAALALLYINCGTLRLYLFAAMALGIYLYVRFPGRLIRAGRGRKAKYTKKQLR